MKLPIESSELRFCAIAAALFVLMYVPLKQLTGGSYVPTTLMDFLRLYIMYFCISVALYCLKNLWKKRTTPPEDDSENGNAT